MRKHEMVYVFYENLPLYDISSHNQKFIKTREPCGASVYGNNNGGEQSRYGPSLPTSILQFKNEKGKHMTQKPTTMMDCILNIL